MSVAFGTTEYRVMYIQVDGIGVKVFRGIYRKNEEDGARATL